MLTHDDLFAIRGIVKDEIQPLDQKINKIDRRLSIVEKGLRKVQRDLKTAINLFDKDFLGLKRRVENVEIKVGIPSN